MTVEQNITRLKHLITMYGLTVPKLLDRVNHGLKKPVTEKELLASSIKLSVLKRVDAVFEKGLHYYLDPKDPLTTPESSVFFRKQHFNTELNLAARKVVTRFEDFAISLSAIAKLAELEQSRVLPKLTMKRNTQEVALEMRKLLYPGFEQGQRDFLKKLIGAFAEKNLLVFEFVETWNQTERANIDGFFLKPNVIVLKRHQTAFRREIFTLAHELGHYMLGEEEVEELPMEAMANKNLPAVERWCNDFAFYFLAGDHARALEALDPATARNDYHFDTLATISKATHLSRLALFTRLLLIDRISPASYAKVKEELEEEYLRANAEKEREREQQKLLDEQQGSTKGGGPAQPIKSPLLINTIQTAFHEGVLSEYEVRERWKMTSSEFKKYFE